MTQIIFGGSILLKFMLCTETLIQSRPQTTPSSASTREGLATCSRFLGLSDVIVTRSCSGMNNTIVWTCVTSAVFLKLLEVDVDFCLNVYNSI